MRRIRPIHQRARGAGYSALRGVERVDVQRSLADRDAAWKGARSGFLAAVDARTTRARAASRSTTPSTVRRRRSPVGSIISHPDQNQLPHDTRDWAEDRCRFLRANNAESANPDETRDPPGEYMSTWADLEMRTANASEGRGEIGGPSGLRCAGFVEQEMADEAARKRSGLRAVRGRLAGNGSAFFLFCFFFCRDNHER